jgi:hypothetical protein
VGYGWTGSLWKAPKSRKDCLKSPESENLKKSIVAIELKWMAGLWTRELSMVGSVFSVSQSCLWHLQKYPPVSLVRR